MTAYSIDPDRLAILRKRYEVTSNRDLARRMEVSASMVSRVLNGHSNPGPRFIAGLRRAFPREDVLALIRENR